MENPENKQIRRRILRILSFQQARTHGARGGDQNPALSEWDHASSLRFLYSQSRLCVTRMGDEGVEKLSVGDERKPDVSTAACCLTPWNSEGTF